MKSPSRARFMLFASVAAALLVASCQHTRANSLGDMVWLDENENGIQNTGERGVSGVIVEVFSADGSFEREQTTNADGKFAFDSMESGTYFLKFTLPPNYKFTATTQGTNDELDSDANQEDGTTIEFPYEKGKDDGRWDAGLVNLGTGPTPTPTPPHTAVPISTPDPAQELYDDSNLAGSSLIVFPEFADIDMINLSGSFMGMSLGDDHPLPNSRPYYLVDPEGRLYFGLLGDTQGLSANISIFRPGDSPFQPTIFSNIDTGTEGEPVRPSFEDGNVTNSQSQGICRTENALLADINMNVSDLEPIGPHSIWVYKLKPSGDGFDLVHVSLTKEQAQAVFDTLVGADADGAPPEPRPFIFGRVYRATGEEIVSVTQEEAAASVLAQLFPDITSMEQFGMLEYFECAELLLGR